MVKMMLALVKEKKTRRREGRRINIDEFDSKQMCRPLSGARTTIACVVLCS